MNVNTLLCLVACILLSVPTAFAKKKKQSKPNVVVIYVDDLGYGDLSCMGATEVSTPNVDNIAKNGILFTDGHCSAATCTPSRYSLLTGSYAFRQKAAVLDGDAPLLIRPEMATLPKMLQENGYKTAVVGKWHLGLGDGNVDWNKAIKPGPLEIGFDYSYLIPATGDRVPCVLVENHHVVGLDKNDPIAVNYKNKIGTDPTFIENPEKALVAADDQHGKTIVNGVSRIGYMTGGNSARWRDETIPYQMLNKARRFIDENVEDPFFLYFAFHDIHVPRLPDHRFQGATDMGVRGDAIVQMDYITGQLVDYLETKGLKENTIIVFSSDNGPVLSDGYDDEALFRLGKHEPGGKYRGGKYSAFEAGTRVPTLIQWPAQIEAGQKSIALFTHVDLYASIASIVGHDLKDGEAPDSWNAVDVMTGKDKTGREVLLEESYTFSLRKGNWKYIAPSKNRGTWIKKNKNIESGLNPEDQLFNLENDPAELKNVASKHPELVKEMKAALKAIRENNQSRSTL